MTNTNRTADRYFSTTITLKGETRTVEAVRNAHDENLAYTLGMEFSARIGAGKALYPTGGMLVRENGEWTLRPTAVVRNRQARIVGWNDVTGITNTPDQTRV